jgi:hypothetical protein
MDYCFQNKHFIFFAMDFMAGGELFLMMQNQPAGRFRELE